MRFMRDDYGFFVPGGVGGLVGAGAGCAPPGACSAGGAPAPGIGIWDLGWFAAFVESAVLRSFCARSTPRSMPAGLTEDSYFASRIFLSGSGIVIGFA